MSSPPDNPPPPENCPPCVIIISGAEGYAAVERYNESDIDPKADTHSLEGQITASCDLAQFTTHVNIALGRPIAFKALEKIIEFHEHIAADIMEMSVEEIEAAAGELRDLNERLSRKTDLR